MKPPYPLVEIWWDDAHCQVDQTAIDSLAEDAYVCTVGYLVRETVRSITVAAELCEAVAGAPLETRSATRIPKGMIVERRELVRRTARARRRIGDPRP